MRPSSEYLDGGLRSGNGDGRDCPFDEDGGRARVGADVERCRGQRADIDLAGAGAGIEDYSVVRAQRTGGLVVIWIIIAAVVSAADDVNGYEGVNAATELVAYQKCSVDREIGGDAYV